MRTRTQVFGSALMALIAYQIAFAQSDLEKLQVLEAPIRSLSISTRRGVVVSVSEIGMAGSDSQVEMRSIQLLESAAKGTNIQAKQEAIVMIGEIGVKSSSIQTKDFAIKTLYSIQNSFWTLQPTEDLAASVALRVMDSKSGPKNALKIEKPAPQFHPKTPSQPLSQVIVFNYLKEMDSLPANEPNPQNPQLTKVFEYYGYWCAMDGCGWAPRALFTSREQAISYMKQMRGDDDGKAIRIRYVNLRQYEPAPIAIGNEHYKAYELIRDIPKGMDFWVPPGVAGPR